MTDWSDHYLAAEKALRQAQAYASMQQWDKAAAKAMEAEVGAELLLAALDALDKAAIELKP